MDIAKFLDQPIRFNPRRASAHSVSMTSSLLPSPPHESTPTSSPESDGALSSETRFSPTQNRKPSPPRTSSPLADGNYQVLEESKQRSATPDSSSKAADARQQRGTKDRKSITKAACSACQRRRSKVRLIPVSIPLHPQLTNDSAMASARPVVPVSSKKGPASIRPE